MGEEEISRRENEGLIEAIYKFVEDELAAGTFLGDIEKMLIAKGLDAESARNAVDRIVKAPVRSAQVASPTRSWPRSGLANMGIGAAWCVGGIAVTFVTYTAASALGGGTYIVAWGAIIFGVMQFLYGLTQAD